MHGHISETCLSTRKSVSTNAVMLSVKAKLQALTCCLCQF